ncbi:MAG: amino acid permease [Armatimonadetes bacterium]|jgi:amino acid transporter|nr:amino acid permease [Armatimonadota bacterium]
MLVSIRRVLIGRPIATARAVQERLDKWMALPIFASDAVSSTAYATEEILIALLLAGTAALSASLPIALGIVFLLVVVTFSYQQTVLAYPSGGGAYLVAKENLGIRWATIAGAALLIGYVVTVSVSVAAGVAAITSAFAALRPYAVSLGVLFILLLMLANLRGLREAGFAFALPSYSFMLAMFLTIGWGLARLVIGGAPPAPAPTAASEVSVTGLVWVFFLLRAYASGCTALTGVEAISNGVQAFKPPEGPNAAITMRWMGAIMAAIFLGVTYLAHAYHILPDAGAGGHGAGETVISKIAETVWGGRGVPYYFVQGTTMLILILAANTSFAGFPRLAAILAQDRFLPRQFWNVGDRLVYSNGIVALAVLSSLLLVVFQGNVHGMLPFYAVGVFLSFTISQAGMVRRWHRLRTPGWRRSATINGVGMTTTFVVMAILAVTRFMPPDSNVLFHLPFTLPGLGDTVRSGAWLVVLAIAGLQLLFARINRHYVAVASQLTLIGYQPPPAPKNTVIVLVPSVNRGTVPALQYAKSLGQDTRALHIEMDPETTPRLLREWEAFSQGIPLLVLESPYRSLIDPLFRYLDEVQTEREHIVTVILPEFVPSRWWHVLLHNQSGWLLKLALLGRKDVIVTNMRYHLKE